VSTKSGETPDFSLTSVFVPQRKQNLAAFMSVGADAAKPDSYGKFSILRLPDTNQVPGPSQIANQFSNDPKVANQLRAFKQADAKVAYGNLLTLPVGGGLLYVQPLYTLREGGSGNYPVLRFVLSSFGRDVGIGSTLSDSLADVLRGDSDEVPVVNPDDTTNGGTGSPDDTQNLPVAALRLLQQADQKFAEADRALKSGDLEGYATAVEEARALVQRAINAK
jgi:hypothetical protein